MPIINGFQFGGAAPPATSVVLSGSMSITASVAGTLAATSRGRYAAGFQFIEQVGATTNSKTLSFSAMPAASATTGRIVVFQIACHMDGSGSISTVSYGGTACSRAIGSSGGGDKGAAEIWYVLMPANPSNNNLIITANNGIIRAHVAREVILGMTQTAAYSFDVIKKSNDQAANISVSHGANGVTFLVSLIWKNGLNAGVNCTYPIGGATRTSDTDNNAGEEFATSTGYYESATAESGRTHWTNWLGANNPGIEMCGASWR